MSFSVITANRLRDGVVVWWTGSGWAESFGEAAALGAEAVDPAVAVAKQDIGRQLVVGVYAASVRQEGGRVVPDNVREYIRARGPSVRLDLGIQSERRVTEKA